MQSLLQLSTPDHTTVKPKSTEDVQPQLPEKPPPTQNRHVRVHGMDVSVSKTDKRSRSSTLPVKKPKLRQRESPDPDQRMDLSATALTRESMETGGYLCSLITSLIYVSDTHACCRYVKFKWRIRR